MDRLPPPCSPSCPAGSVCVTLLPVRLAAPCHLGTLGCPERGRGQAPAGPSSGLCAPGTQGVCPVRGVSTCSSSEPHPGTLLLGLCGEDSCGGRISGGWPWPPGSPLCGSIPVRSRSRTSGNRPSVCCPGRQPMMTGLSTAFLISENRPRCHMALD